MFGKEAVSGEREGYKYLLICDLFPVRRQNGKSITGQKRKQHKLPAGNASDEIKEICKKILWSLLMKLKVLNEEASNIIGEIGGHGIGYLFENMDEIDIGALKRNTAREKQRADEAQQRAEEEKQRADALEDEVKRLRKLLEIQEQK